MPPGNKAKTATATAIAIGTELGAPAPEQIACATRSKSEAQAVATTAAAERGRRKREAVNYDESASVQSDEAPMPKPKRQKMTSKKQISFDAISRTSTPTATDNESAKKKPSTKNPAKKPARPKNAFKATEDKSQDQADADYLIGKNKAPQQLAQQFYNILDGYNGMFHVKVEEGGFQDTFTTPLRTIRDAMVHLEAIAKSGEVLDTTFKKDTKTKGRGAGTKRKMR